MNFLLFLLGLLLGGMVAWFIFHKYVRDDDVKLIKKLNDALSQEKEKRMQFEIELRSQRANQGETLKKMQDTFDALAARALQNQMQTFGAMAKQTIDQQLSKANDDYSQRTEAIERMVKPIGEALLKYESLVKDFQLGNSSAMGNLKGFMDELNQSQIKLAKETNSLVNALKTPKVRGRWGEIGLKRIVEYSGLNSYCDFTEQQSVSTNDGLLRPDMVIHLPSGRKVVVDSKVPLAAYLELVETDNQEQQKDLLARHAKAVMQHVRDLSSKSYWAQFDGAVDFVVLYLEVEPAFGAALSVNKELIGDAIGNKIVFATPSTLISLLQTIAFAWKQHSATENAEEILKTSKELHNRLLVFADHYQKIGSQIGNLVKSFNLSLGSWETRVMPGIRRVEELGGNKLDELPTINSVDTGVRNENTLI